MESPLVAGPQKPVKLPLETSGFARPQPTALAPFRPSGHTERRERAGNLYLGNQLAQFGADPPRKTKRFTANQITVPQSQPKAFWPRRATRSVFNYKGGCAHLWLGLSFTNLHLTHVLMVAREPNLQRRTFTSPRPVRPRTPL